MNAKTVAWFGPIGVFEFEKFRRGTWDIARAMAETDAKTIIGGGDSAAATIADFLVRVILSPGLRVS